MDVQIVANGTPLPALISSSLHSDSKANAISIMSMNLLAPLYVRPIDKRTGSVQEFAKFDWVKEDSILDWESRKLCLLNCLTSCQAHVICLQELQLERGEKGLQIPNWLSSIITDFRYTAILPSQEDLERMATRNVRVLGADAAVTCAVLVQTENWDVLEPASSNNATSSNKNDTKDSTNYVTVCLQHKTNKAIDPIVVSSVHLDAKDEEKRISQLSKFFARASNLLDSIWVSETTTTIPPLTTIVAGDMNAEFVSGSCMSAMLTDFEKDKVTDEEMQQACSEALRLTEDSPPTTQQLKQWKKLQSEAEEIVQDYCLSLNRVDTGPTRAAYSHDGLQKMEQWKLDHMLYSTDRLTPVSRWSTLESDAESSATGLPNHKCPSDHMPIATVFAIQPTNPLSSSKREDTLNRLRELSRAQKKALEDLETEMELKRQEILKQVATANDSEQQQERVEPLTKKSKTKKKKQKKVPPPKEVMEVLREKRARLKQLKKDHLSERGKLVKHFNNLECLLIQQEYGMKWREWVSKGK